MDYNPTAPIDTSKKQVIDLRDLNALNVHAHTARDGDRDYAHPDDFSSRGGWKEQFDVNQPADHDYQPGVDPPSAFDAPTSRPGEPITHGVDIGPGDSQLSLPTPVQPTYQSQGQLTKTFSSNPSTASYSGALAQFYLSALSQGA